MIQPHLQSRHSAAGTASHALAFKHNLRRRQHLRRNGRAAGRCTARCSSRRHAAAPAPCAAPDAGQLLAWLPAAALPLTAVPPPSACPNGHAGRPIGARPAAASATAGRWQSRPRPVASRQNMEAGFVEEQSCELVPQQLNCHLSMNSLTISRSLSTL